MEVILDMHIPQIHALQGLGTGKGCINTFVITFNPVNNTVYEVFAILPMVSRFAINCVDPLSGLLRLSAEVDTNMSGVEYPSTEVDLSSLTIIGPVTYVLLM